MIVESTESFRAEALHDEPELENVCAARALKASDSLIEDARRLPAMKEIGRLLRESALQIALIPYQHHAGRQRQQHHLVGIPGQRARVREALERARRTRGQKSAGAV